VTSYATLTDLAGFLTAAGMSGAPANGQLLLDRASRLVTRATMTAVYAVDSSGVATDPAIVAALKAATLEQVAALISLGAEGVPTGYQSVTAGRISFSRDASSAAIADGTALAPQAYFELQQAGLTGQEAWTC